MNKTTSTYQNHEDKIELYIPEKYKKLGISISGGADSALMTYLLFDHISKNNLPHEIYFVSGVIKSKGKWKKLFIEEIVEFMRDRYPTVIVKKHDIVFVDELQEMFDVEKDMLKNGVVDIFLNATTKNPPYEDLVKHDMLDGRLLDRDEKYRENWRNELGGTVYKPFINVNKKFISQCYKDLGLLDDLFNMTISCEKRLGENNFDETPCKKCWWCKEKKWAFGVYDKGVI